MVLQGIIELGWRRSELPLLVIQLSIISKLWCLVLWFSGVTGTHLDTGSAGPTHHVASLTHVDLNVSSELLQTDLGKGNTMLFLSELSH